ncbi:MAG: ATP-dependent RecD-like DNA helicase [Clostridia bacterium]|nr:ATP-dependent RecD-like DNA helicase [Clostridia bacterium]
MPDWENAKNRAVEEIEGTVEEITFRNEQSGFTVMELDVEGDPVIAVGALPPVNVGEEVHLYGHWTSHPKFGRQFAADSLETTLPSGATAILRYLSSGAVKGIGPSTAAKIVEAFGERTLDIIENQPLRLAEIRGISKTKAQQISDDFRAHFGLREAMNFLGQYKILPQEALAVWKRFGTGCIDMIREDPYLLCAEGLPIGFERADAIALGMEKARDSSRRISAGLTYVLTHNLGNGHTCLPREKLINVAAQLLELERDPVAEELEAAVDDGEFMEDEWNNTPFVFLPTLYQAELYVAGRITTMSMCPAEPIKNYARQMDLIESMTGIAYNARQTEAIDAAMNKGLLVLTGGPGTGKTTTLNAIIQLLEMYGHKVAIAAPTGRAAKRITEITGHEAKTIHRLLEVEWGENDTQSFARNDKNPLDCDALIVDELSMTDILLFQSLLRAVKFGCRLVLVGDSDQLPSVGAGNVLGDLIQSGRVPVVQLTEVFRQAQKSAIVMNAHRIVGGEMPQLDLLDNDFFFLPLREKDAIAKMISDLCFQRLPDAYGFHPLRDIQVLCPGRKGELGTVALNQILQQRFNPSHQKRSELKLNGVTFRQGDKIMQVKNNYNVEWTRDDGTEGTGIYNGDVGMLEEIDRLRGTLKVRFDDRVALYSVDNADELEHAYAITVHKSQGSEFPAVIIPMYPMAPQLCYRNLLYTAVTRAKKILIMVGHKQIALQMTRNQKKTLRYSALSVFLQRDLTDNP